MSEFTAFGGATTSLKSNLVATTNPSATDDTTAGYSAGSLWMNVTTGSVFRCRSATAGAAAWVAMAVSDFTGYVSGNWYSPYQTRSTAAVTADSLNLCPITIRERTTISALGARVATAGAGGTVMRLGLYKPGPNSPGGRTLAKVAECSAELSTAAVASVSQALTANYVAEPGAYYLGALFSGTPTMAVIPNTDSNAMDSIGTATLSISLAAAGIITGLTGSVVAPYASGLPAAPTGVGRAVACALVAFQVA